MHEYFKPELLNRLSQIVIFDPVSHEQLMEVVKMQMKSATTRVANKGISLSVSDAALDVILSQSYNPVSICLSLIIVYVINLHFRTIMHIHSLIGSAVLSIS